MIVLARRAAIRLSWTRGYSQPRRPSFPHQDIAHRMRMAGVSETRGLATPPPQLSPSNITQAKYHEVSDSTMEALLDSLEGLVDELNDPGNEVEYSSGVLTLSLTGKGTYVINKQPPNQQIWLSSPTSGPKRYDFDLDTGNWIYSRDKRSIGELLEEELSAALSRKIVLDLPNVKIL